MGEEARSGQRTIAEKLDYLIKNLHPRGRGPYTYREIEALIKERAQPGEPTVTHATINNIHAGKVTNPGVDSLRAIASFFGVGVGYFLDDKITDATYARIQDIKGVGEQARAGEELANTLENSDVRAVAFRLGGLSAPSLRSVKQMVEALRAAEGLPDVSSERQGD